MNAIHALSQLSYSPVSKTRIQYQTEKTVSTIYFHALGGKEPQAVDNPWERFL